ncbi:LysR substrate-binding domain-containing protein [Paenalcaligenes sp. Me131]|uniref:LysR substrate-binding domain-containing protein n=1 Tax=Paenalcaligenes sp. Me131 TaxID=3392636 RepID=UPI003D27ED7C
MISLPFQAFLLVAQHGSITYAAQRLALSQPTITNYIRQIEQRYGIELFYRQGKGLVISKEGQHILPHLLLLQQQATQVEFMLRDYKKMQGGCLRVGATGPYYIMEKVHAFQARYPAVEVCYLQKNSVDILNAVRNYELEIGTSSLLIQDDAMRCKVLAQDQLFFVCHTRHPLARKTAVSLNDLVKHDFLVREQGSMTRHIVLDSLQQHDVKLASLIEVGSREAIHWALRHNMGCSLLPQREIPPFPDVRTIPLLDVSLPVHEYVYFLKERQETAVIQAFVDTLELTAP